MFVARFILFGSVLAQLADALTFTIGVSRFGISLEGNGIATGPSASQQTGPPSILS